MDLFFTLFCHRRWSATAESQFSIEFNTDLQEPIMFLASLMENANIN